MGKIVLSFFTVAGLHFLAVVLPGPDFAITVKHAVMNTRVHAIYTAAGIAVGILVHLTYCLLGLALIISESPPIYHAIQWVAGMYLLFMGYKALLTKKINLTGMVSNSSKSASLTKAFSEGFLCNVLNPKATLFFLSVFTLVISPETPIWFQVLCGGEMFIVTFLWFSFLAFLISNPRFKPRLQQAQLWISRLLGVAFIFFGAHMILDGSL